MDRHRFVPQSFPPPPRWRNPRQGAIVSRPPPPARPSPNPRPMRHLPALLVLGLAMSSPAFAAEAPEVAAPAAPAKEPAGPLDFTLKANDGSAHDLGRYRGKVVLLVNTASKCGFTKQYKGLEALYQAHKDQGLVVIAVPANEFGAQEPGTDEEIRRFCTAEHPITFPLMAKTVVKGKGVDPLYAWLTAKSPFPGEITWNFNKFLVGRDGKVVARFDSKVAPEDPKLVEAVAKELAKEAPGK